MEALVLTALMMVSNIMGSTMASVFIAKRRQDRASIRLAATPKRSGLCRPESTAPNPDIKAGCHALPPR